MQDFLIEQAVGLVFTFLGTLISVFGVWLLAKMGKSVELKNLTAATDTLIEMTKQTVDHLNQTVVEKLKASHADGKLTAEEIKMLGDALMEITEAKLSDSVKGLLTAAKVDLEALIKSTAESYIDRTKGWK